MAKHQSGGGGQSRAAKKRAKQKNKKRRMDGKQSVHSNCQDTVDKDKSLRLEEVRKKDVIVEGEAAKKKKREESKTTSGDDHTASMSKKKATNLSEDGPDSDDGVTDPEVAPQKISQILQPTVDDGGKESDMTAAQRGRLILQSLLHPAVTVNEFYSKYWEKLPLHVSASKLNENGKGTSDRLHGKDRFDGLLSMKAIERMISQDDLRYKYDLNVTKCDESTAMKRINFDENETPGSKKSSKEGIDADDKEEALPDLVDPKHIWPRFHEKGCSIRLLCPHKHSDSLHSMLSMLESEFGCMVGCNAYLTPGHASQGFAPHYDDIEAFVLQVEGKKRWRVYKPISVRETLPRLSSDDFRMVSKKKRGNDSDSDDEMFSNLGKYGAGDKRRAVEDNPVLDLTLEPGDLLYMPRGWVHQAVTPDRDRGHSLHLTVSCMQQWAWAEFLELVIPEAVSAAIESDLSAKLREGLPRNFLSYMGAVHDTNDDDIEGLKQAEEACVDDNCDAKVLSEQEKEKKKLRENFHDEAKKCISRVSREAMSMVDAACDQLGKRFLSDRLPPAFTEQELATSADKMAGFKVLPNTMCRLAREGIARLVLEDGKAVLYHCMENSREFHGNPLFPMEFELDDAPALEMLLTTTAPHWICVNDLVHGDIEDKVEIAQSLFDEGILSVFQPDRS